MKPSFRNWVSSASPTELSDVIRWIIRILPLLIEEGGSPRMVEHFSECMILCYAQLYYGYGDSHERTSNERIN